MSLIDKLSRREDPVLQVFLCYNLTMVFDRQHFHFFGGREVTSLHFTLALLYFAEGLISVFVPVYFWKLGIPLWKILFFYFLHSLYFLILLFLLLPALRRLSDKMMMFLSLPFLVLYYFGLSVLSDFPDIFYALPVGLAANMLFFNTGYHIDFLGVSDKERFGQEMGLRHMLASLAQFSSPFLGGALIASFGFAWAFYAGSAFLLLAVLPLFFFPKRTLSPNLAAGAVLGFLKNKTLVPFTLSGVGMATERMIGLIFWPLFLYFAFSGSVEDLGVVISLGVLAGSVVAYLIGFMSDHGKRRRMLFWSAIIFAAIWAHRSFLESAYLVAASSIAGYAAYSALTVAWSSQYYKIAGAVSDASAFILSREALYHFARVPFMAALVIGALYIPQDKLFIISFFAAAAAALLFLFANRMPHANQLADAKK